MTLANCSDGGASVFSCAPLKMEKKHADALEFMQRKMEELGKMKSDGGQREDNCSHFDGRKKIHRHSLLSMPQEDRVCSSVILQK